MTASIRNELYNTEIRKGELLNDRFEIIDKVGHGGFGSVYSAYDKQNKRKK